MKRGWHGPRMCVLCYLEEEETFHIFHSSPFFKSAWNMVSQSLKLRGHLKATNLEYVLDLVL